MRRRTFLALAGLSLLAPSGLPAQASNAATSFQPWTGGPRPAFALDSLHGGRVALQAHRGRRVLLHFFATWCEPCLEELPALDRLNARVKQSDITILAISVAEPDDRVRRFFARAPVRYAVLLDRDRAVTKSWGVTALPTTIVLDTALQPRLVVEQEFDWDGFEPGALGAARTGSPALHAINRTGG